MITTQDHRGSLRVYFAGGITKMLERCPLLPKLPRKASSMRPARYDQTRARRCPRSMSYLTLLHESACAERERAAIKRITSIKITCRRGGERESVAKKEAPSVAALGSLLAVALRVAVSNRDPSSDVKLLASARIARTITDLLTRAGGRGGRSEDPSAATVPLWGATASRSPSATRY